VLRPSRIRFGQRGWLGLVGVLIALVIVALLAQTVLKSHGLLGGDRAQPTAAGTPGAVAPAAVDATEAAPARTTPIERARGVERDLQRDAQDLGRRIDEQTK